MGLRFFLQEMDIKNMHLFDFPLRNAFTAMSFGNLNMAALRSAGFVNDALSRDKAVTFVDTHDTNRDQGGHKPPIMYRKMQAYSYILCRAEGYPLVFWKDLYNSNSKEELSRILQVRKYYAFGPGREVNNNTQEVYSYVREGLDDKANTGLVMMITTGTSGEIVTKKIKTNKPETTFYDYTRNIKKAVTTDEDGYAEFKVRKTKDEGWSIWVPSE